MVSPVKVASLDFISSQDNPRYCFTSSDPALSLLFGAGCSIASSARNTFITSSMLGASLRCNSALRELRLSAPSLKGSYRNLRFFRTGHKPAHSPSDEERPPQRSVPFEWQSEVASNLNPSPLVPIQGCPTPQLSRRGSLLVALSAQHVLPQALIIAHRP